VIEAESCLETRDDVRRFCVMQVLRHPLMPRLAAAK
jgi:hypothetical protein